MPRGSRTQLLVLIASGLLLSLHPGLVLSYTTAEVFEVELSRWVGIVVMPLALVRLWALRVGGGPALRMRRWARSAGTTGCLYFFTTNPLFLVLTFSLLVGALLDGSVERVVMASDDLAARLRTQEG